MFHPLVPEPPVNDVTQVSNNYLSLQSEGEFAYKNKQEMKMSLLILLNLKIIFLFSFHNWYQCEFGELFTHVFVVVGTGSSIFLPRRTI